MKQFLSTCSKQGMRPGPGFPIEWAIFLALSTSVLSVWLVIPTLVLWFTLEGTKYGWTNSAAGWQGSQSGLLTTSPWVSSMWRVESQVTYTTGNGPLWLHTKQLFSWLLLLLLPSVLMDAFLSYLGVPNDSLEVGRSSTIMKSFWFFFSPHICETLTRDPLSRTSIQNKSWKKPSLRVGIEIPHQHVRILTFESKDHNRF